MTTKLVGYLGCIGAEGRARVRLGREPRQDGEWESAALDVSPAVEAAVKHCQGQDVNLDVDGLRRRKGRIVAGTIVAGTIVAFEPIPDAALVVVAPGGTSAEMVPGIDGCRSSLSGYRQWDAGIISRLIDGGAIIDKLCVEYDKLVHGVVSGPMVDITLSEGEVNRCPKPSGVLVAGLQGEFKVLAAHKAANPKWSGFDYVSIPDYCAYWRSLGARIGRRRGDRIVWEDGAECVVPSADFNIYFDPLWLVPPPKCPKCDRRYYGYETGVGKRCFWCYAAVVESADGFDIQIDPSRP